VIERAVILAKPNEATLKPEYLPFELSYGEIQPKPYDLPMTGNLDDLLANYEREILRHMLNKHDWNQTTAAKALNISERVMRYKIRRLSLPSPKK
jgi:two-component system response regulator AtoC